jgi:type III secretory pathway component EscS
MNQNTYQIFIIIAAFCVPVFSIVGVYVSVKVAITKIQVEIENLKIQVQKLSLKVEKLIEKV